MKSAIDRVIQKYGEPVELTLQGESTLYFSACVQLPVSDALVNDFDVTGFVVYMRVQDTPRKPSKFDRMKIRGEIRGIEEVQEETLGGEVIVYIVRTRG